MKKIICLGFVIFLNFLNAQEIPFKFQKSKLFEDDYKDSKIILAEKIDENEFVVVRSFKRDISSKRGYYIEKYNDSLIKTSDFEFQISHQPYEKYSFVLSVFCNKSSINIIETFQNIKSKEFICQATIIDNNYNSTQKELFRLNKEELRGFSLKDLFFHYDNLNSLNENSGDFRLKPLNKDLLSSNKDKILNIDNEIIFKANKNKDLFSLALTFNDKKINTLKLYLYDKNFNRKFEKIILNNSSETAHHNIELDDLSETIYLTDKKYLDELKNKETGGKYRYEIKKITSQDIETSYIDVKNYYIPQLKTYMNNSKLYCLGFISNESDLSYNGISFFDLDTNFLKLNNSTFNLFSNQFILDKYGKLRDKEIRDISIKNVFFNDNEVFINAEEEYLSESGVGYSRIFYNYDDLISIKLSSSGNLLYARNINKRQSTDDKDDVFFFSYFSFLKNNKNYFFINTNDELRKLSNDRIEFKDVRKSKSNLCLISIDENGSFKFNEVLDNQSNEVPFMVSKGIFLKNSIIFLGRKGRKKQLLKVTL